MYHARFLSFVYKNTHVHINVFTYLPRQSCHATELDPCEKERERKIVINLKLAGKWAHRLPWQHFSAPWVSVPGNLCCTVFPSHTDLLGQSCRANMKLHTSFDVEPTQSPCFRSRVANQSRGCYIWVSSSTQGVQKVCGNWWRSRQSFWSHIRKYKAWRSVTERVTFPRYRRFSTLAWGSTHLPWEPSWWIHLNYGCCHTFSSTYCINCLYADLLHVAGMIVTATLVVKLEMLHLWIISVFPKRETATIEYGKTWEFKTNLSVSQCLSVLWGISILYRVVTQ